MNFSLVEASLFSPSRGGGVGFKSHIYIFLYIELYFSTLSLSSPCFVLPCSLIAKVDDALSRKDVLTLK